MMLLASLLVLALASAEDNIENVKKAEKELKTLIKSTGLDLEYVAVLIEEYILFMIIFQHIIPVWDVLPRPKRCYEAPYLSTPHLQRHLGG